MLGDSLKKLRGKRTQQEIAKALGISRARYAHYENDIRQPDYDTLQQLADFFDVPIDTLFGRTTPSEFPDISKYTLRLIILTLPELLNQKIELEKELASNNNLNEDSKESLINKMNLLISEIEKLKKLFEDMMLDLEKLDKNSNELEENTNTKKETE